MIDIEDFENQDIVKDFLEHFDVYYSNLGGYRYTKDNSACLYLNGMFAMFMELQKEIEGWECAREAMFRPYKRD